jgi:hypothetical protein
MENPLLTCRELIDFLAAYLDGELARAARRLRAPSVALPQCVEYPRATADDPPRQAGLQPEAELSAPSSDLVDASRARRR